MAVSKKRTSGKTTSRNTTNTAKKRTGAAKKAGTGKRKIPKPPAEKGAPRPKLPDREITRSSQPVGEYRQRSPAAGTRSELPESYGENNLHLNVRDPYWLYAYWEVREDHVRQTLDRLGGRWHSVSSILRLEVVTGGGREVVHDIPLPPDVRNWFVNVDPNRTYVMELGLLHDDGRYIELVRSNAVTAPRAGVSEVIDEEWAGVDFDTMYALSGGFDLGKSSEQMQREMRKRLERAVTSGSGALSSIGVPAEAPRRGFRFVLDCELVVYGATEPDARLTLQGRPVALRPDGTFSTRFALPDGHYDLAAVARSADGNEIRYITPVVERITHTPEPVTAGEKVEVTTAEGSTHGTW